MRQLQGKDVALSAIRKTYGPTVALPGIDLSVARGEFCTLLGASGSGKTTLLKVIAGFEQPDRGNVRIAGKDVTRAPIADRNIGMVFQNYALFPHMSVFENVAFSLRMRRLASADIEKRVSEALALVSMEAYRRRLPGELSGGQQQRTALARALVFNPDILLMDEPLGALDKHLRQSIQLQIKQLHRDLGLTIVFVTHDQEEAMHLSDRIIIMDKGAIVADGTPQTLYRRPANRFVAGFLGECNFLAWDGAEVVGIRPEHLQIGDISPDARHRYQGNIVMATFCGLHWKLLLEHQGQHLVAYAPVDLPQDARTPGQTVIFGFQGEHALHFKEPA
ncbi:ABC transporter ATP-binding protein [Martelella alba]|uniref:ABC transporter ATP-binding protein n=1 Tax=Martelella alba TaxID=2590451 RepID=A0ABY2SQW1_9HYPH|nr:ABC transporter ATP-binding protein [Martelella alba]TKI08600.1 ABC transporter ATP-binding protein [Martelella alba]